MKDAKVGGCVGVRRKVSVKFGLGVGVLVDCVALIGRGREGLRD